MTSNIHEDENRSLLHRLHPDLFDIIDDIDSDEQILHRFSTVIFSELTSESAVDKVNADFLQRKQVAESAWAEKQYQDYLMLMEPSCRATVFADELAPLLHDEEYWSMLRQLWLSHTLPPHWDGEIWFELFASPRKQRELLMSEDERAVLAVLPATVTVYRGGVSTQGLGWTLDKDKARFFAESFAVISPLRGHPPQQHQVFTGAVPKEKVYAYFERNGDEEMVVDPSDVTVE